MHSDSLATNASNIPMASSSNHKDFPKKKRVIWFSVFFFFFCLALVFFFFFPLSGYIGGFVKLGFLFYVCMCMRMQLVLGSLDYWWFLY